MNKNILVTGAGALLGQGILRCLQEHKDLYNIYTADPNPYSSGHWLGKKPFSIPFISESSYQSEIEKIIVKCNIDVIFVGTDVELPFFAERKEYFKKHFNVIVVVSSEKVIEISNDKYKTAIFLKENNFPYPDSVLAKDIKGIESFVKRNKFPFFAKPVDGARSKGLVKINDEDDLNEVLKNPKNLVIQEFLSEDQGEYTTGVLVVDNKCKSIVSLKRELRDGNTFKTFRDSETSKYDYQIKEIAEKLGVNGPCNFQYRIKDNKPIIFEINGRYSGTTPLRSYYGFNEVKVYLDYILSGKDIIMPELKEGMVFRTFSDIFIDNDEVNLMFEDSAESPRSNYYPFKS